ncbi:MAG: sugar phosphate nucleotidyltransferase [Bacteroidota bacterium]
MKAIIPVAGVGTRLRPLTYTQPKPLIPIAGKPIISFIIDQLQAVGVEEFVFIIGYLGEKIKLYVEEAYPNLAKEFVSQKERVGSGHAIWTARKALKGVQEAIIVFGDSILDIDFDTFMATKNSCLAVRRVEDPRDFGIVEFDENKQVVRLVEKPKIPKSNVAMVGLYKVKELPLLLKSLNYNIKNNIRTGDEFPLTDGLMRMLQKGVKFDTLGVNNWYDCGKISILLETNATLLDKKGYASANLPPYDNTIIINPVSIGKDCVLKNSIIGPHVTIGENTTIRDSIVKNSIIGNYAAIKEVILQNSVVGNDAGITGLRQSLNIGDNTEIDFS